MAAREFHGVIVNQWESPLIWSTDDCDSGEWQDPWYPSKVPGAGHIDPSREGEFRSESNGVMTGTSGWARWGVRVNDVFDGDHFEYVQINWAVSYINFGRIDCTCVVSRNDPKNPDAFAKPDPRPALLEIVFARRTEDGKAIPVSDGSQPGAMPLGGYVLALPWSWFLHGAITSNIEHPRVDFIVRRRPSVVEPIAVAEAREPDHGIIYIVDPVVEALFHAEGGPTPASGGNLRWLRHLGREHGTFQWEGPKKVGIGWGGFAHLFSNGDGIVYGVTPVVPATEATGIGPGMGGHPASGGDLLWYRHAGREHGGFQWEGPKKVGIGWGGFAHLFSGGEGIIYGVTPVVKATQATGIGPGMGGHPASGGDLMWYRHVGREDGSFQWEGPTKVGIGWGTFAHLFSGGDGIIYGITPVVPATEAIGIGPGMGGHHASGGDLIWYRHIRRDDGTFQWEGPNKVGTGWGGFAHVFSGGEGIIYGVTPVVPATDATGIGPGMSGHPASGGDLIWYRHVGWEDGSFRWASSAGQKVGRGWSVQEAFSG